MTIDEMQSKDFIDLLNYFFTNIAPKLEMKMKWIFLTYIQNDKIPFSIHTITRRPTQNRAVYGRDWHALYVCAQHHQ